MNAQNLKIICHPKVLLWAIDYILHLQNVLWSLTARSASSWHCAITPHTLSHYTPAKWVKASQSLLLPSYRFCCWPVHLQLQERCSQWDTPLSSVFPLTWDLIPVQPRQEPSQTITIRILNIQLIFSSSQNILIHCCSREIMWGFFWLAGFDSDLCGSNGLESNIQANAFSELSSWQFACS